MAHVVWFVGLSGAGKTSIATAVAARLDRLGRTVSLLDGDDVRRGLCSDLGFSEDDVAENIRRIASVAAMMAARGDIVLVATISPLERHRRIARSILPDMVQVFVDAPLELCETRDPKGLYRRSRQGLLVNLAGVDTPFEVPSDSELTCRTAAEELAGSVQKVLSVLGCGIRTGLNSRRQTIAVDFDGVIANYDGWTGKGNFGSIRSDVVSALESLRLEGWKIVVHSTRNEEEIQSYLRDQQVPFDEINSNCDYSNSGNKPVATVYWDDRAVRYSGDAFKDLNTIRHFTTWSGRS